MRDINVNLEHLIDFRNHLVQFNQDLQASYKYMHGHVEAIRDDWDDPQYERFREAFDEVAEGIHNYLAVCDEHEDYLARLIERGQDLLDTRM